MENRLEDKSLEQLIRELNTMREIVVFRHKEAIRELDSALMSLKQLEDEN